MTHVPIADASKILGVPDRTLRNWIRDGAPHERPERGPIVVDPESLAEWARDRRATPDVDDEGADSAAVAVRLQCYARLLTDLTTLRAAQDSIVPTGIGDRHTTEMRELAVAILNQYPSEDQLSAVCRHVLPSWSVRQDGDAFSRTIRRHSSALCSSVADRGAESFTTLLQRGPHPCPPLDVDQLADGARDLPLAELRRRRALVKAQLATIEACRASGLVSPVDEELKPVRELFGQIIAGAGDGLGSRLYERLKKHDELTRELVRSEMSAVAMEVLTDEFDQS